MILLTNASELYEGAPLVINPRYIISVFEQDVEDKIYTTIFGMVGQNTQTWQVEETVEEVYKLIKKSNTKT